MIFQNMKRGKRRIIYLSSEECAGAKSSVSSFDAFSDSGRSQPGARRLRLRKLSKLDPRGKFESEKENNLKSD